MSLDLNHIVKIFKSEAENSVSRLEFWNNVLSTIKPKNVAEVGVWKGDFASNILHSCSSIEKYYMIDPWKNLDDWNKPANVKDDVFDNIYQEAVEKTKFAETKREILRGRTVDVIDGIPDNSLDFIYIDGDHTLKGITIDLINFYNKLSDKAILAGDDFSASIWQHSNKYEPTFVFPFAVYFAQAVKSDIYALPFNQFAIIKNNDYTSEGELVDMVGSYRDLSVKNQLSLRNIIVRYGRSILRR